MFWGTSLSSLTVENIAGDVLVKHCKTRVISYVHQMFIVDRRRSFWEKDFWRLVGRIRNNPVILVESDPMILVQTHVLRFFECSPSSFIVLFLLLLLLWIFLKELVDLHLDGLVAVEDVQKLFRNRTEESLWLILNDRPSCGWSCQSVVSKLPQLSRSSVECVFEERPSFSLFLIFGTVLWLSLFEQVSSLRELWSF